MTTTWDGGEWEYPNDVCSTCRELPEDCICPLDYDEADEADDIYQQALDERGED